MESRRFQRKIESFICEICLTPVDGDGFTNHCPNCLWSRHVDVNPGDRAQECGGMMEPIELDRSNGKEMLLHQCSKCGARRRNKVHEKDNLEALIAVSARR